MVLTVPTTAADAWRQLNATLAQLPPVPCQTSDNPAAWWPEIPTAATTGPAAACRRCPAQRPCLTYALAADEQHGIWGGTTPAERQHRQETPA